MRQAWLVVTGLGLACISCSAHAQEQLGAVHFATSCNPKVAPAFDRAVALHERAMNELVVAQPADTEAKIFYAIALAGIVDGRCAEQPPRNSSNAVASNSFAVLP